MTDPTSKCLYAFAFTIFTINNNELAYKYDLGDRGTLQSRAIESRVSYVPYGRHR